VSIKYSELDRLQKELLAHSDRDPRTDREILEHATLGARSMRDPIVAQLVAKVASRLYHDHSNALVHVLCRGALIAVLEGEAQGRDLLPFALQLVHRASHASPSPLSIKLPDETTARARAYFENCAPGSTPVDKLTDAVRTFVLANDGLAGGLLFARLIADLEFLQSVVEKSDSDHHRQIALSALTYFVDAHDAIDDDLGVVGILDDAYVAQLASEKIDPSRAVKTAIVDAMLAHWPFLATLRLELDGGDWSPSEFMLLNLAAAFGPEAARLNSIVLPRVSNAPLWVGTLAAIGSIYETVDRKRIPFRPRAGEFIAVAGHESQHIEVLGYYHPDGGRPTDRAEPDSARLVALRYLPRSKKSKSPPVMHHRQVTFLENCVPTANLGSKRRISLPGSRSDVPLGPLELLFGLDHPARLDDSKRRIVVVAPLGEAKEFLATTSIFGRPLLDLIPCGDVAPESQYETRWWSTIRSSIPILTIARDVGEAAAIVSQRGERDVSVVFGFDRAEWPSASIHQLAEVHVTAILPQSAGDAQTELERSGYRFLDWTPKLESTVSHRARATSQTEIDDYETEVRRELHAELRVHEIELESVETGLETLKILGQSLREDYDDEVPQSLATWAEKTQRLFFDLGGSPVAIDTEGSAATIAGLEARISNEGRLWSERCHKSARAHFEELQRLFLDLARDNPKSRAVAEILSSDGTVVHCSNSRWEKLSKNFPRAVRLGDRRRSASGPALVFEWPGRDRIGRILFPPVGDPTHFVFYRWERSGLSRVRKAREQSTESHWRPNSRLTAWHVDDVPHVRADVDDRGGASVEPAHDDVRMDFRRQSALARTDAPTATDVIVDALAVYFTDDRYAFITPDRDVLLATHLRDTNRSSDARLKEAAATDLKAGDLMVIIAGSERDAIRESADTRLPAGARALARTWHGALIRFREKLGSDRELWRALQIAGCSKTEVTVSWWLRSTTQIGPHEEADVDVIARATSDAVLISALDECKKAIRLVRGEHLRSSHDLATRALAAINERIARGDALDSAIQLGDRAEIVVVDAVDEALVKVPASATNVVQDF
jgi:hypothetical protein